MEHSNFVQDSLIPLSSLIWEGQLKCCISEGPVPTVLLEVSVIVISTKVMWP